MKNFLSKISLRRIVLFFCISYIILVIIACYAFYTAGTRQIHSMVKSNAQNIVEQVNDSFVDQLDEVHRIASNLTSAYSFHALKRNVSMDTEQLSPVNFYNLSQTMTNFYSQNLSYFSSIILYLDDASILYYKSQSNSIVQTFDFDYELHGTLHTPGMLEWTIPTHIPFYQKLDQTYSSIGLVEILGSDTSQTHGFFMLEVNDSLLSNQIKNARITPNSLMTVTQNNQLLFDIPDLTSHEKEIILEQLDDISTTDYVLLDTQNNYLAYQSCGIGGLGILAIIPKEELFLDQNSFSRLLVIILLFVFFIGCILYFFTSYVVSKPVIQLSKKLKQVYTNEKDVTFDITGSKEITSINREIQGLLKRIRNLITSLNEEMEEKRIAEVKALYSQINPHFLYNTLDSIYQLCDVQETKLAQKMTEDLADFYRIGVSKGMDSIPLEKELKHMETYMSILKTRFQDFQYTIQVPEEYYSCRILKITLQPLVENAIYHGIRPLRSNGTITVSAKKSEQNLLIFINDDGSGMSEETLLNIRRSFTIPLSSQTEQSDVYGLRNVHERLCLTYGKGYGLSIESKLDCGTTVIIKIPYLPIFNRIEEY